MVLRLEASQLTVQFGTVEAPLLANIFRTQMLYADIHYLRQRRPHITTHKIEQNISLVFS